jgi:phosphatidylcholine synthase
MDDQRPVAQTGARVAAWGVHLFSATGAVLALLAVAAVSRHDWTEAMYWLLAALVVDGVDGTLARAARVKEVVPRIDGDALDLVIDYLNYVFVPTLFMWEAELLPSPLLLAALIQFSSLYVFARRDMKTDDGYFRGFPALWNIVALYLFAAGFSREVGGAIVAALVLMTFAPIHFAHPFRARDYGIWLPAIAVVWAATTVAMLFPGVPEPLRPLLLLLSSGAALTIVALGLVRSMRGPLAAK